MKLILHECTDFDVIDVYRKGSDFKTYWKIKCQVCGDVKEELVDKDAD
jgi:hypothetical protein